MSSIKVTSVVTLPFTAQEICHCITKHVAVMRHSSILLKVFVFWHLNSKFFQHIKIDGKWGLLTWLQSYQIGCSVTFSCRLCPKKCMVIMARCPT